MCEIFEAKVEFKSFPKEVKEMDISKVNRISNKLKEFGINGIDEDDYLVRVVVYDDRYDCLWTNTLPIISKDGKTVKYYKKFRGIPPRVIQSMGMENIMYNMLNKEQYPYFPNILPLSLFCGKNKHDVVSLKPTSNVEIQLKIV